MTLKEAIKTIENLRDYAEENWIDKEYADEVKKIKEAVKIIKAQLRENKAVGMAEINGKKYLISSAN